MKQTIFVTLNTLISFGLGIFLWTVVFGGAERGTILNTMYEGGPLVIILIAILLMLLAFVVERFLSLRVAKGKSSVQVFFKNLITHLQNNDFEAALAACDKQRGTTANVLRAGIERYMRIKDSGAMDIDKKIAETQTAVSEANALEGPLLERNLIALSTIASIATMVGLLGTTIGMIRMSAQNKHHHLHNYTLDN